MMKNSMNKNLCQLFKLFGSDQFRFLIPKSRTVGSNTSICVPNPTLLQTPSIWFGGYGCVDIKILCQPKKQNKTKQIVIYLNLRACQMRSIYLFKKLGLNGNIGKGVEEVGPYQSYWLTKMLSWTYRTTIIIPNKPKNSRAHASRLVVSIPETTHLLMLHHLPMWRWNVGQR
jgi:hypothetical protein